MNQKALSKLSYGLFVASTKYDKKMNGCIINTVTQVTSNPKQIIVSINKNNLTCKLIQKSGILAISVLSETAPFSLFEHFGFQSGRTADKFLDIPFAITEQELPYLTNHTTAYLDCKVKESLDLGSHMLFLAYVSDCDILSDEKPMTYAFYHEFVKPKPETSSDKSSVKGWRCTVCGYVYEGEELPPDFVCPLCKHGAEDFEKILS
ncbi:MAG: flavin reductase [bacterium]|nr:flavin reductase [bacterium]MCM1424946.1 flavin reductase [bacterium]